MSYHINVVSDCLKICCLQWYTRKTYFLGWEARGGSWSFAALVTAFGWLGYLQKRWVGPGFYSMLCPLSGKQEPGLRFVFRYICMCILKATLQNLGVFFSLRWLETLAECAVLKMSSHWLCRPRVIVDMKSGQMCCSKMDSQMSIYGTWVVWWRQSQVQSNLMSMQWSVRAMVFIPSSSLGIRPLSAMAAPDHRPCQGFEFDTPSVMPYHTHTHTSVIMWCHAYYAWHHMTLWTLSCING